MEIYQNHEDHVDVHPGQFLLSSIFFSARVVVTRLWVAATQSWVGVTLDQSDLNLLLATAAAAVLLLG
jgi:hypothetical protein